MTMGHLKAGVTPGQAVADLNSIGQDLLRKYPKDEGKMTFKLVRPSMYGDYVGGPVREFLTGLMLLASLILLAACANLGSLFAARAADRSRKSLFGLRWDQAVNEFCAACSPKPF